MTVLLLHHAKTRVSGPDQDAIVAITYLSMMLVCWKRFIATNVPGAFSRDDATVRTPTLPFKVHRLRTQYLLRPDQSNMHDTHPAHTPSSLL